MRRRSRTTVADESGFTLIEVMVVVVIIAVLSSMLVIVAMPGDIALADKEARRADMEARRADTEASRADTAEKQLAEQQALTEKMAALLKAAGLNLPE